jgi:hypothetical protein
MIAAANEALPDWGNEMTEYRKDGISLQKK